MLQSVAHAQSHWESLPEPAETDVLVAGMGPAGLIAALAIAHRNAARAVRSGRRPSARPLRVTVAGTPVATTGPAADTRTTAIMGPNIELLKELGVWPLLEGSAAPLRAIRLIDDTGRMLRAPEITFHARELMPTDQDALDVDPPGEERFMRQGAPALAGMCPTARS